MEKTYTITAPNREKYEGMYSREYYAKWLIEQVEKDQYWSKGEKIDREFLLKQGKNFNNLKFAAYCLGWFPEGSNLRKVESPTVKDSYIGRILPSKFLEKFGSISIPEFLLLCPSEKDFLIQEQETIELMKENITIDFETNYKQKPMDQKRDETLDLYQLLDCLLLKTNFNILKEAKASTEKVSIMTMHYNKVFGELKNMSVYTAISSLPRVIIVKEKKDQVEGYLQEQRMILLKELNVDINEFNNKLGNFSWSWIWFTFNKLSQSDLKSRYATIVCLGLANGLETLMDKCRSSKEFEYKLKNKNKKVGELSSFMEELKAIGADGENISLLAKRLIEVKQKFTDGENFAAIETNKVMKEIEKDIIKIKKAPRKIILT